MISSRVAGRPAWVVSSLAALSVVGAAAGLGALGPREEDPAEAAAPAFETQVDIVYTVNNLGYTMTCG